MTISFLHTESETEFAEELSSQLSPIVKKYNLKIEESKNLDLEAITTLSGDNKTNIIFIALISASFLEDYQLMRQTEILAKNSVEGSYTIVPVIVELCDYRDTFFSDIRCLPKSKKAVEFFDSKNNAFAEITVEISKLVIFLSAKKTDSSNNVNELLNIKKEKPEPEEQIKQLIWDNETEIAMEFIKNNAKLNSDELIQYTQKLYEIQTDKINIADYSIRIDMINRLKLMITDEINKHIKFTK